MNINKISELLNYLKDYINKDDVIENIEIVDDKNIIVDGAEFMVLDEEEADKEAKGRILDLTYDIGLNAFSNDYIDRIFGNFIIEDRILFHEVITEYYYGYVEDLEYCEELECVLKAEELNNKEELADKLIESVEDFQEWYCLEFGTEAYIDFIRRYDLIDYEAIAEDCISLDGRGIHIASYDGEEMELDNYYAYRTN